MTILLFKRQKIAIEVIQDVQEKVSEFKVYYKQYWQIAQIKADEKAQIYTEAS